MSNQSKDDLRRIELLILDVDGVLTDGRFIIDADGRESKSFSAVDGHGIRLWRRAGLQVALISGRQAEATAKRAVQLEIEHVFQNCHFKLPVLKDLLTRLGLEPAQVAYVGDDLPDLPIIRYVGFGVAVANAVPQLKRHADYVTTLPGGGGAVREVIEHILKGAGRWDTLMDRYLA